jgi:hypothetical protein
MFDQTICAVIGTCFRLAWTRLLTGDGQLGSNPQPEAKLGEKSDSLRNQALSLIETASTSSGESQRGPRSL